ncbi:MAG: STAS domain-containing protein [Erysipelotrichaceae bacterium]|nr:STAS domain-containing protein [Erysipelotrichaceae bacterium]MBQ4251873.1 STAS domain-containing protein [Erysipelotrichaceae bacterium]
MNITSNKEGKVLMVALNDRLDSATATGIEGELYMLVDDEIRTIVLDCQGMEYIASTGLRILLTLYKLIHARHGELILKNVDPYVMEIFEMTGFDEILKIEK